jgi:hypothetical protein
MKKSAGNIWLKGPDFLHHNTKGSIMKKKQTINRRKFIAATGVTAAGVFSTMSAKESSGLQKSPELHLRVDKQLCATDVLVVGAPLASE